MGASRDSQAGSATGSHRTLTRANPAGWGGVAVKGSANWLRVRPGLSWKRDYFSVRLWQETSLPWFV